MKTNHRLDIRRIEEAFEKVDPVFLRTPQYSNESLSQIPNTNAYSQDRSSQPTLLLQRTRRRFSGIRSTDKRTNDLCKCRQFRPGNGLQDMKGPVDDAILVRDVSILEAMRLLHLHTDMVTGAFRRGRCSGFTREQDVW